MPAYEPLKLWCVYTPDFQTLVLFEGELPALRYAVSHSMLAKKVNLGVDLMKQMLTPDIVPASVALPEPAELIEEAESDE